MAGRVLVLFPRDQDANAVCRVLSRAGMESAACDDMETLCRRIRKDGAVALVGEEALTSVARGSLRAELARQPTWSDFPLVVLLSRSRKSDDAFRRVLEAFEAGSNVAVLERPLASAALVSFTRLALRARARQIQVRRELDARRAAERALRESERRLMQAERAGRVGVFDWDLVRGRVYWTPAMHDLLGVGLDQEPSFDLWMRHVHPEDRSRMTRLFERWIHVGEPTERTWEYRYRSAADNEGWMAARAALIRGPDGRPRRILGINTDVTEVRRSGERLKRMAARLKKQADESRALAERRAADVERLLGEQQLTEHRERERLAAFLHDEVQQLLVAAKMGLAASVAASADERPAHLRRAETVIEECLFTTRHMSRALVPPTLEAGSLGDVLRWLQEWFRSHHNMEVGIESRDDVERVSASTRTLVFQAVRELLLNVVKHAGVQEAHVASWRCSDGLVVQVTDQGCGFDVQTVEVDDPSSLGLPLIRRRVAELRGTLEVESAPGRGARFRLTVPIDA